MDDGRCSYGHVPDTWGYVNSQKLYLQMIQTASAEPSMLESSSVVHRSWAGQSLRGGTHSIPEKICAVALLAYRYLIQQQRPWKGGSEGSKWLHKYPSSAVYVRNRSKWQKGGSLLQLSITRYSAVR
jgi:hypothetical protein